MKKKKSFLQSKFVFYFKNKFVLTFLGFLVWLSFFDRNDFITTWSYHQKLVKIRNEKTYYENEVLKYNKDLSLMTDARNLEKYGREKYYMKKDNEDVFLVYDESAAAKEKN